MARLSKEALANRSRFQFQTQEVPLPELGDPDGTIAVRSLSVAQRDALPHLNVPVLDGDGKPVLDGEGNPVTKPDMSVEKLAEVFAVAVVDPSLSAAEANEFLGGWPIEALDRVFEKFSELIGTSKEEQSEASTEFRGSD
jgi:hypothetical protein